MKQVYETNDEVELQMLIGLLESNGIYTQIYTDGAGDYLRIKGSDFMIPKGVLVKDKDWKEALEIINANGFGKKKKVPLIFICFADLLYDSVNHMLAFPYLGKNTPGHPYPGRGQAGFGSERTCFRQII